MGGEEMYQDVTILGRLGTDPALRYTPSGVPVCNFSVAVNRRWTDAEREAQEETTWFKVVTWQGLADTCADYLKKGRLVLVNGRIRTRQYEDADGHPRQTWELVARDVRFADNGTVADEPTEVEDQVPV
jgi:single-strand DNA-binding protein